MNIEILTILSSNQKFPSKEECISIWNDADINTYENMYCQQTDSLKIKDPELYNIWCFMRINFLNSLSIIIKSLQNYEICVYFHEWLEEKKKGYNPNNIHCEKKKLWEDHIIATLEQLLTRESITNDKCKCKPTKIECPDSSPLNSVSTSLGKIASPVSSPKSAIFSICFTVIIIITLSYFFYTKIKRFFSDKYNKSRFLRKCLKRVLPLENKEDLEIYSENECINILYL
ncbi:variable surface protein [Plasmodium gonderi]|uniref:Variable surface protein n=1 Tax=Plasmodium gonderi TaxID=77519 RepID=A0A1Y1JFK0_PLAGO|nr:variable surface protein [Plasmodium gonderi]GAW80428.1 variable surface protein [Plasmodium gonderi]